MEVNRWDEVDNLLPLNDFNLTDILEQKIPDQWKQDLSADEVESKLRAQIVLLLVDLFVEAEGISLPEIMCALEKKILIKALVQSDGNIKKTSQFLGIKYTTLHEKLKRHNISIQKQAVVS